MLKLEIQINQAYVSSLFSFLMISVPPLKILPFEKSLKMDSKKNENWEKMKKNIPLLALILCSAFSVLSRRRLPTNIFEAFTSIYVWGCLQPPELAVEVYARFNAWLLSISLYSHHLWRMVFFCKGGRPQRPSASFAHSGVKMEKKCKKQCVCVCRVGGTGGPGYPIFLDFM